MNRSSLWIAWVVVIVAFVQVTKVQGAATNLYKTLGVSKDCSASELKKAYRKQCLKYHPDKASPDKRDEAEAKFKEVNEAYDTLSDDNKRALYDEYGAAGLEPNFQPGFGGFNPSGSSGQPFGQDGTFQFFSGSQGSAGPQQSPFGFGNSGSEDLRDILRGIFGDVGGGPSSGRSSTSSFFRGMMPEEGNTARQRPQKSTQSYTREVQCSLEELAKGRTKNLKVKYPIRLSRYSDEAEIQTKLYSVEIKPGWKSGTKIKFPARDGFPAMTFVVKEKKHDFLERRGNNLVYRCKITPRQAENGARITIPMPDGENLTVVTKDQVPTRDGHQMTIRGKGMPIKGGPQRGNLIIEFRVVPQSSTTAA